MLMDMHTMLVIAISAMSVLMVIGGAVIYWIIRTFYRLYITSEKRYMMEKKYRQDDADVRMKNFTVQLNETLNAHKLSIIQSMSTHGMLDRRTTREEYILNNIPAPPTRHNLSNLGIKPEFIQELDRRAAVQKAQEEVAKVRREQEKHEAETGRKITRHQVGSIESVVLGDTGIDHSTEATDSVAGQNSNTEELTED